MTSGNWCYDLDMESKFNATNITSFHGLGIAPGILEILGRMRFLTPTPIQSQAIPVAIEGKDVVGIAQTGTA